MLNTLLGTLSSGVAASTSSYESIATVTAVGGETSLSFTSIPGTYASLQIRFIAKDTDTAADGTQDVKIRFNSDSGSNYVYHYLRGNGTSAVASGTTPATSVIIINSNLREVSATSTFGVGLVDILDYSSSTKNKTVRYISGMDKNTGTTASRIALGSGLWVNTNAITSVTMLADVTAFKAGTTFALYGIKG